MTRSCSRPRNSQARSPPFPARARAHRPLAARSKSRLFSMACGLKLRPHRRLMNGVEASPVQRARGITLGANIDCDDARWIDLVIYKSDSALPIFDAHRTNRMGGARASRLVPLFPPKTVHSYLPSFLLPFPSFLSTSFFFLFCALFGQDFSSATIPSRRKPDYLGGAILRLQRIGRSAYKTGRDRSHRRDTIRAVDARTSENGAPIS